MRQFFAILVLVLVLVIVASGGCQANGGTHALARINEPTFRNYWVTGDYPSTVHISGYEQGWDMATDIYGHRGGYNRPDYNRGHHPGHGAQPRSVRYDGPSYRYYR